MEKKELLRMSALCVLNGMALGFVIWAACDALNNYFRTDILGWIIVLAIGLVVAINIIWQIYDLWKSREHIKVGGTD